MPATGKSCADGALFIGTAETGLVRYCVLGLGLMYSNSQRDVMYCRHVSAYTSKLFNYTGVISASSLLCECQRTIRSTARLCTIHRCSGGWAVGEWERK